MNRWLCKTCGCVVAMPEQPWCRHGDISLIAARMVPLPSWHPAHRLFGREVA